MGVVSRSSRLEWRTTPPGGTTGGQGFFDGTDRYT